MLTLDLRDAPWWDRLSSWTRQHGLSLQWHPADQVLPASYWGAPEAGVIGDVVTVSRDTPLHSLLHEAAHIVCARAAGRTAIHRDAGGDDIEEAAVCALQLLVADQLPGVGWRRLACDMDAWGYSFRVGSTAAWWCRDASDARHWLLRRGLLPRSAGQVA